MRGPLLLSPLLAIQLVCIACLPFFFFGGRRAPASMCVLYARPLLLFVPAPSCSSCQPYRPALLFPMLQPNGVLTFFSPSLEHICLVRKEKKWAGI